MLRHVGCKAQKHKSSKLSTLRLFWTSKVHFYSQQQLRSAPGKLARTNLCNHNLQLLLALGRESRLINVVLKALLGTHVAWLNFLAIPLQEYKSLWLASSEKAAWLCVCFRVTCVYVCVRVCVCVCVCVCVRVQAYTHMSKKNVFSTVGAWRMGHTPCNTPCSLLDIC